MKDTMYIYVQYDSSKNKNDANDNIKYILYMNGFDAVSFTSAYLHTVSGAMSYMLHNSEKFEKMIRNCNKIIFVGSPKTMNMMFSEFNENNYDAPDILALKLSNIPYSFFVIPYQIDDPTNEWFINIIKSFGVSFDKPMISRKEPPDTITIRVICEKEDPLSFELKINDDKLQLTIDKDIIGKTLLTSNFGYGFIYRQIIDKFGLDEKTHQTKVVIVTEFKLGNDASGDYVEYSRWDNATSVAYNLFVNFTLHCFDCSIIGKTKSK